MQQQPLFGELQSSRGEEQQHHRLLLTNHSGQREDHFNPTSQQFSGQDLRRGDAEKSSFDCRVRVQNFLTKDSGLFRKNLKGVTFGNQKKKIFYLMQSFLFLFVIVF